MRHAVRFIQLFILLALMVNFAVYAPDGPWWFPFAAGASAAAFLFVSGIWRGR